MWEVVECCNHTHLERSGVNGHCHCGPANATKISLEPHAVASSSTHRAEPCVWPGHHPQPAALHSSHDAECTEQYGAARVICKNALADAVSPTPAVSSEYKADTVRNAEAKTAKIISDMPTSRAEATIVASVQFQRGPLSGDTLSGPCTHHQPRMHTDVRAPLLSAVTTCHCMSRLSLQCSYTMIQQTKYCMDQRGVSPDGGVGGEWSSRFEGGLLLCSEFSLALTRSLRA